MSSVYICISRGGLSLREARLQHALRLVGAPRDPRLVDVRGRTRAPRRASAGLAGRRRDDGLNLVGDRNEPDEGKVVDGDAGLGQDRRGVVDDVRVDKSARGLAAVEPGDVKSKGVSVSSIVSSIKKKCTSAPRA